jgi:hypothetical protein
LDIGRERKLCRGAPKPSPWNLPELDELDPALAGVLRSEDMRWFGPSVENGRVGRGDSDRPDLLSD